MGRWKYSGGSELLLLETRLANGTAALEALPLSAV